MYKFRNFHLPNDFVWYIKMTKKIYYCRIPQADGTNRFCWVDAADAGGPGETEHPLTEEAYKRIRGVAEAMFSYHSSIPG
jgi:hypothetical protein